MSEKTFGPDFSARSGGRELEIFLLRDSARKEFQKMQDEEAKRLKKHDAERLLRYNEDVRAAKVSIASERAELELNPPFRVGPKVLKDSELQAAAEHRVDAQNAADRATLVYQEQQRQDAFLAQQREERLLREAQESREMRERVPPPLSLKQEFDRSR